MSSARVPKAPRHLLLLVVVAAIIWLFLPGRAAHPQHEVSAFYLGNSVLESLLPSRLLTKNAHVAQFLCSPDGLQIAYTTSNEVDGITYTTLAVEPISGGAAHVYRQWARSDAKEFTTPAGFFSGCIQSIQSWSPNGQFVLFRAGDRNDDYENQGVYCLNTRIASIIGIDKPDGALAFTGWSPDSGLFAFLTQKSLQLPAAAGADPNADTVYENTTAAWICNPFTGRIQKMAEGKLTQTYSPGGQRSGFRISSVGWINKDTAAFR